MQQAANLKRRAFNVYERKQSRMHTCRHMFMCPAYSLDYFTLASTPKGRCALSVLAWSKANLTSLPREDTQCRTADWLRFSFYPPHITRLRETHWDGWHGTVPVEGVRYYTVRYEPEMALMIVVHISKASILFPGNVY